MHSLLSHISSTNFAISTAIDLDSYDVQILITVGRSAIGKSLSVNLPIVSRWRLPDKNVRPESQRQLEAKSSNTTSRKASGIESFPQRNYESP